ncbi:urea carboxylase-associated family protein [Cellulomonas sp. URHE0023]|uniref:DUF1989 domain-containing protein n=1 Tax=Cellulomonas sp. URHE0023 TaxID=1380354 RepID=UPI000487D285|nr:urea carboxylase-associated family protein [Cellulomonas sp. URHE0023]
MRHITLRLTDQQLELVTASLGADEAPDAPALVRLALRETADGVIRRAHPRTTGQPWQWWDGIDAADETTILQQTVLEAGTGKAFEVRAGQVLRVEQVTGDQCVDLNVFNLHDYREFMHVGRTRTLHGTNPSAGSFLWSAPPRERALMYLQTDTAGINDTLFPRCSANMYESIHGFAEHTNCADIQAEAQREYGLTPDDVHDSFNLFMATRVVDGMPEILRQSTAPGDHVELLALVDVLAVPNVCGNDIMGTSNFSLNPVRVSVQTATRQEIAAVPPLRSYATQRTPADFRQSEIRTERRLAKDPDYQPAFARTPVRLVDLPVELDETDVLRLKALHDRERYADEGDALRDVLLSWWVASHG